MTTLPELGGTSWKVSALSMLLFVCDRPQEPKTVPALGDCTCPPPGVTTSQPRKVVSELPELGARVNVTGAPAVREVAPPGACVNITRQRQSAALPLTACQLDARTVILYSVVAPRPPPCGPPGLWT